MKRITHNVSNVAAKEDANAWANEVIEFYTEVMGRNLGIAKEVLDMLLESKCPNINVNDDTQQSIPSTPQVKENKPAADVANKVESQVKDNKPAADVANKVEPPSLSQVANDIMASQPAEESKGPDDSSSEDSDVSFEDGSSEESDDDDDETSSSSSREQLTDNWVSLENPSNETNSDITESKNEEESESSEHSEDDEDDEDADKGSAPSIDDEVEDKDADKGSAPNIDDEVEDKDADKGSAPSIDNEVENKEADKGSAPSIDNEDDDDTAEQKRELEALKSRVEIAKVDVLEMYPPNTKNPDRLAVDDFAKLDERYSSPDSPDWMKLLPALKLRCVAAHYLQKILLSLREDEVIGFVSHETVSNLLKILNASRDFAENASKNEHLAHAFQEAMFAEWGISDEMGEEALENVARLNHTQGSAMFFLTQTAGATNGVNRLLTALHDHEETFEGEDQWDRRDFAGQHLVATIEDIFVKFAESEAKEGHKVDPNVWRNSSESGVKVAMYCTSFASVVVGLLRAMLSFEPELIERNKGIFFPLVCELVGVRSEEIRKLVRRVLSEKFGPILGIGQDTGGMKSIRLSLDRGSDHGI